MINRVTLTGRLTRDVDLRATKSGLTVGMFTLAVDRQYTGRDGARKADFINCIIWRKPAENLAKYAHKGSLIGVDGRVQTRNYDDKNGQRVYVTEVVVDNFAFLGSNDNSNRNASNSQSAPTAPTSTTKQDPFAGNSELDISDDDLPF